MAEIQVGHVGLIFIEEVVHWPEFALGGGGFGGLRCDAGMGVDAVLGEIAEDEAEAVAHDALDFFDDRVGVHAVGALVVAVFE